jgi:hypothetical protein
MPECLNHPEVPTAQACANCGRPFCPSCLVDFADQPHCGPCRDYRLAQMQHTAPQAPPTLIDHVVPAKNPLALFSYYVGVFSLIPCAALLLGPTAIVLGVLGLRAQRQNPNLPGKGHSITGIVLGAITSLANWGVVILGIFSAATR